MVKILLGFVLLVLSLGSAPKIEPYYAYVVATERPANSPGLVEPGEHPNYTVQLPLSGLTNNTGLMLQDLLKQNPQYVFAFTNQTQTGPRNLVGYFDPVLPATTGIWTTPVNVRERYEYIPEAEFYRPSVTPPFIPPVVVPPVLPPVPPVCNHDCHSPEPSMSAVPETKTWALLCLGLAALWIGKSITTSHVNKE